jgi:hypothetical protein
MQKTAQLLHRSFRKKPAWWLSRPFTRFSRGGLASMLQATRTIPTAGTKRTCVHVSVMSGFGVPGKRTSQGEITRLLIRS